ncbi:MAG: M23 family metallopeptidase [Elusimicrobia bacterium]|nr:M23 family metallopeptidase [Elusimicrobiota bacterium]
MSRRIFSRSGRLLAAFLWSGCLAPAPPRRPSAAPPPAPALYGWPLFKPRILSPYGPRGRRFHVGLDLIQTRGGGDPILASRDGVVEEARVRRGYGKTVLLRHPDGWFTRYAHGRKLNVREGQRVARGDVLGWVGRTGRATTAHLHFEILKPNRKTVDPKPRLFPATSAPPKS